MMLESRMWIHCPNKRNDESQESFTGQAVNSALEGLREWLTFALGSLLLTILFTR